MRKILVPTDFSEIALNAAKVAAEVAKLTGARLYFLHVVDIPKYADNYTMRPGREDVAEGLFMLKLVRNKFKELFAQPFLKEVNVAEVLQFDTVYETISTQAKKNDIYLIVMGSHGSSGFSEIFIGSNTEKVVRLAHCPVLTVKKDVKDLSIKNIVFASNFNDREELHGGFEKVKDFAKLFKAKIHLLKIITPSEFETQLSSVEQISQMVEKHQLKNATVNVFNDYTIEDGIKNFSAKIGADLIALGTHGRTGISHLLSGSIAEDCVNHFEGAVLTVRTKRLPAKVQVFPDNK